MSGPGSHPQPASATGVAGKFAALARIFPPTLARGLRHADAFRDIEAVCLFVGYPRSGHTLVGALLDAHPDAVIAHEMDLLRFVYARFFRSQLCAMLVDNARRAAATGHTWGTYAYAVPGQWQGRFRRIRVIGDKHGEATSVRLHFSPSLLERTARTFRHPVKLIHVIRNPYDNIATISRKPHTIQPALAPPSGDVLRDAIEYYFALCAAVERVRRAGRYDVMDVRHEAFVADPAASLTAIGRFLGLAMDDDYLRAASAIVNPAPLPSRTSIDWPAPRIAEVAERMRAFPFLEGYGFEE